MVYPPNWATLDSPAAGQKNAATVAQNWVTFHLSVAAIFLNKFVCFLSNQRDFETFQCQSTFFFSGLKHPGEQSILIIHFMQKSTN